MFSLLFSLRGAVSTNKWLTECSAYGLARLLTLLIVELLLCVVIGCITRAIRGVAGQCAVGIRRLLALCVSGPKQNGKQHCGCADCETALHREISLRFNLECVCGTSVAYRRSMFHSIQPISRKWKMKFVLGSASESANSGRSGAGLKPTCPFIPAWAAHSSRTSNGTKRNHVCARWRFWRWLLSYRFRNIARSIARLGSVRLDLQSLSSLEDAVNACSVPLLPRTRLVTASV